MFLSFRLVVVLWGIIFAGALPAPRNLVVDGAVPVPTPSESPASIPTPDSLSARASSEQSGLGAFCRSGVLTALSITAQNDLLTRTAPVTALSNSVINACINDVLNILVTELAIQRTSSTTLEFTPVSAPAAPAVDLSTSNSAADAQLLELPTAVAPATSTAPVQCTKRPRPLVPGAAPGQLDDDVDLDEPLDNESDEADLGSPISDAEDIHGISKRGPPFRPVAAGGVRPITVPAAAAPFRGVGAGAGPVAVVPAAGTAQRIGAGTVPARPITVPVAVVPAAGTAQRIGAGTVPAIAQPRPGFGAGTGTGRAGAGVVNFRSNPYLTCMTRTYLQCD
ncbi:hypothetical protein FB45DRAFT_919460 [Roridomyces roridus]|uniref:Uncharacterized protein n=1 Tax=Roridomyces roridus TaxID=1738132 RepID=A0AAD7BS70_9AGAR|nr:hypothetical protein FB45DRAFT_919460 [Roridomyces roridus]